MYVYMYVYARRQMPIVTGSPHDPLLRSLLALCRPLEMRFTYICLFMCL